MARTASKPFRPTKLGNHPRKVSDLMRINPHFRRSVQIELDFADPASSKGYVATEFVQNAFDRLSHAFADSSTARSWRITGDYGSGKSAFVLNLAKAACGRERELPEALRGKIKTNLQPIFVTGEREPLHTSIGKAIIKQWRGGRQRSIPTNSAELIDLVESAHKHCPGGILLILDELGKNLEHAMMSPESSDVYVLQRLAELASRSGKKPLVVIAILHMGVGSYTTELDANSRREWDKVAGRFDELPFLHPFEQTVQLCAEAIGLQLHELQQAQQKLVTEANASMKWAVTEGLFGSASLQILLGAAPRIFPLHPVTLPPLVELFHRLGQNERSLFSFLSGHEPAALQEVAALEIEKARFYRLYDLYDFTRKNIAHTLTNGRSAHWRIIESVVRRADNPLESAILKTIGILNLIDDPDMPATRDLVLNAMGRDKATEVALNSCIEKLKSNKLLYERGSVRSLALWPHSSVHLDDAYEDARTDMGEPPIPMLLVSAKLNARQIVARRHYVQTGNLRHFELQFHPASQFDKIKQAGPQVRDGSADGFAIVLLPENEREYRTTLKQLKDPENNFGENVLIGILNRPPRELLGKCRHLAILQHIQSTVKELAADEFARRELRSQIRLASQDLDDSVDEIVALGGNYEIDWFRDVQPEEIDRAGLGATLSTISDKVYHQCPVVTNELINRRITSSAASRARTALIEAIATHPEKEYLGMDNTKNPPEMAIYLSVLKAGKLHIPDGNQWKFVTPKRSDPKSDPCRLKPSFDAIKKLLKDHDAQKVPVPTILEKLRDAPIGARDGLIPLILALYIAANRNETALFEDNTFTPILDGDLIQRLTKEPEAFEIQRCVIEGARMEIYEAIAKAFKLEITDDPQVLDVVRPLMHFVATLPEYVRNTKKLSHEAVTVRNLLLTARDPAQLIFRDLPNAITPGKSKKDGLATKVSALVAELSGSYDSLLARLSSAITEAFGTTVPLPIFRKEIGIRSKAIADKLVEIDVKAFTLRIGDTGLQDRQWLESMANHLSKKSASRWNDADEEVFHQRLIVLAQRMLRAEAAQGGIGHKLADGGGNRAVRLLLTKPDGNEQGEIFHWSEDEQGKVDELTAKIEQLLKQHGRAGLGAAAKAIWNHLEKP
jgi:hypothetical protein